MVLNPLTGRVMRNELFLPFLSIRRNYFRSVFRKIANKEKHTIPMERLLNRFHAQDLR